MRVERREERVEILKELDSEREGEAKIGYLPFRCGEVWCFGAVNGEPFDHLAIKLNPFVEQHARERSLYKPLHKHKIWYYLFQQPSLW